MSIITPHSTTFQMIGGNLSIDFANHMMRLTQYPSIQDQFTILLSWMEQTELLTKEQSERYPLLLANEPELVHALMQKVIDLQDAVYNIFWSLSQGASPDGQDIEILNAFIKESYCHLTIREAVEGFLWQWEKPGTLNDCLWPIIRSAAELLTSDLLSRVRLCPGEPCGWIFLDTTKNRSRKWCDMRDCGNVVKARNFRKRQKDA